MSKIAFRTEELMSSRTLRKRMEKPIKLTEWVCSSSYCRRVMYDGPTSVFVKWKDEKGKEFTTRVPRRCPECGNNMIKRNVTKEEKRRG